MSLVIGIDLGTSTTEACVYRNGKPEMIYNPEHEVITPSFVGLDPSGNWVVGAKACAQYLLYPDRTAMEVKRKIGTEGTFNIAGEEYDAVTLSARILSYVKTYASAYLGESISRAVISVPAYFDDIQRQETILAGKMAGLQVERILNEPTAAALSYGLDHMDEESHILVYDLGGGTFDVTLLEMFDGVLDVKASSGDNQLGGKDFDQAIMNYLLEGFKKKHRIDLTTDRFAMVKIKEEAEACKKALTKEESYRITIPMITKEKNKPLDIDVTITREEFEKMTANLLERTHHPMEVVLQDAGLTVADLSKIILVGGSTRMPMVAKDIEAFMGIKPEEAVNPDLAVSTGAAIQAGIIEGSISADEGLLITDVNPYTLGVRCISGYTDNYMSVIIPRNVTIPTTRSQTYWTSHDYQTEASIEVYQGESEIATSNRLLGEFMLGGIPSKKQGKESLNVEFSYDLNGMLNVRATINSTGKEATTRIDMNQTKKTYRPLDEASDVPVEDVANEELDLDTWRDVEGADEYRTVIRRMERLIKRFEENDNYMGLNLARRMYDSIREAIINEDWDEAASIQDSFMENLSYME